MRGLIDFLLGTATIVVLSSVGAVALAQADTDVRRLQLEREARRLYAALERFHERYGCYPNDYHEPRLELDTLEPLERRGYYENRLTDLLLDRRLDAYDSPDDRGKNREFWLEMTFVDDPRWRYVVARSADAPLGAGRRLDGVYVLRHGSLRAI